MLLRADSRYETNPQALRDDLDLIYRSTKVCSCPCHRGLLKCLTFGHSLSGIFGIDTMAYEINFIYISNKMEFLGCLDGNVGVSFSLALQSVAVCFSSSLQLWTLQIYSHRSRQHYFSFSRQIFSGKILLRSVAGKQKVSKRSPTDR